MNASNPIQIDGKTYDRYSLNLAITGKYKAETGQPDAQIAMRLIPTRIADGAVETADAAAIGISLGTLAGSDQATQQAVAAIQAALQAYLQAKGL
jgi:hypothetical protein